MRETAKCNSIMSLLLWSALQTQCLITFLGIFIFMTILPLQAQECPLEVVRANRAASVFIHVDKIQHTTGAVLHESGSGFIVSPSGYVLTAAHVVTRSADVDEVKITGAIGSASASPLHLSIIHEDKSKDLALLKFDNTNETYSAVSLGDPSEVGVGDPLCSTGFPLQTESHLTVGHLGSKGGPRGLWQVDMASTQGESGAPVFTTSGQVVAIKKGGYDEGQNINLLIPLNLAQQILLLVPDIGRNTNISGFAEIAVRSKSRHYDVTAYNPVKLSLDVDLRSEKKLVVDDGVLTLQFWILDEGTRSKRQLTQDEVIRAFSLDEATHLLPLLDDQNNKATLEVVVGCQQVGNYEIVAQVTSHKKRLTSEDRVDLNVRPFDIAFLSNLPKGALPTYVLQHEILNVAPQFLAKLGDFRVVLLDEASRTNLSKATLWLSPEYLGSMGGFYYKVSIDGGRSADIGAYYKRIMTATTVPSTLVEVGAVNGTSDFVPVGGSMYEIWRLDPQRMGFRRVLPDPCKLLVSIEPQYSLPPDQKANVTILPRYGIRITANLDSGATGRNGLLSVTVDDETYEEMMWAEPGNDVSSDFPVFIPVTKSERRAFLRIQTEQGKVVIDVCPLQS